MPVLARMLLRPGEPSAPAAGSDAAEAGREQGRARPPRPGPARRCAEALAAELDRARLRPRGRAGDDDGADRSRSPDCPFRELAEANPDLVCSLHRGLVEGFVDAGGRRRASSTSATSADRTPVPGRDRVRQVRGSTVPRRYSPSLAGGPCRDHAHRHRCHEGQGPHRGRGRAETWRSASPSAPAAAPASATRCSSTPTSPTTTTSSTTAASASWSTPSSAAAPPGRHARLQGRPPGRRLRHRQPQRAAHLRLRPVLQLTPSADPAQLTLLGSASIGPCSTTTGAAGATRARSAPRTVAGPTSTTGRPTRAASSATACSPWEGSGSAARSPARRQASAAGTGAPPHRPPAPRSSRQPARARPRAAGRTARRRVDVGDVDLRSGQLVPRPLRHPHVLLGSPPGGVEERLPRRPPGWPAAPRRARRSQP